MAHAPARTRTLRAGRERSHATWQVHRFRRTLGQLPEKPRWPAGFAIVPFDPSRHALLVHGMLEEGYRDGGGRVAGFASWWSGLAADAEYDPA